MLFFFFFFSRALSILDQFFKGDSSQNEPEDRHQYKIHAMGHCHIDTGKHNIRDRLQNMKNNVICGAASKTHDTDF